jgi:hypothetical protein
VEREIERVERSTEQVERQNERVEARTCWVEPPTGSDQGRGGRPGSLRRLS